MRRRLISGLCLAGAIMLAAPVAAQDFGLRAGASVNPDQLYFGGHLETEPIVERLHLRPNVEIGFLDDVTLTTVNFEVVWKFPPSTDWTFYAGGGPAINIYRSRGATDSDPGFNAVGGVENRDGLFFEIKLGARASPELKFGIGYTFRR